METLLRLEKKYNGRISAMAGPLAEGRTWSRMQQARDESAPAFHNGGHLTGCGCPSSKIAIRADGAIVPCSMLAHMELGWINHDRLIEVWQNHPELDSLQNRRSIPLESFDFCAGCEYSSYCTGNCPGLAYTLTGQVNHPSPDACLRRFLADGGRLDTLEL
jgi:SynChlorMet cassette radical SAM/SPASM protein ScmE